MDCDTNQHNKVYVKNLKVMKVDEPCRRKGWPIKEQRQDIPCHYKSEKHILSEREDTNLDILILRNHFLVFNVSKGL